MRSVMILFITLGVLLSLTQAKPLPDVRPAKFNQLNKKRALLGDILNFQGGDLISLFGSRYDLGSSYGQRNNNDYMINSHNNEMPSTDPDFPFDGFFDDKDFLDDPELPGDGDMVDDVDNDSLNDNGRDSNNDTGRDFLDDPVFPGDDIDLPSDGEFIGGQAGINGNRFRQLNDDDDEDEDEDDEDEDDEDNDCNYFDLQDETT